MKFIQFIWIEILPSIRK